MYVVLTLLLALPIALWVLVCFAAGVGSGVAPDPVLSSSGVGLSVCV